MADEVLKGDDDDLEIVEVALSNYIKTTGAS